jgi:hypothetical protein
MFVQEIFVGVLFTSKNRAREIFAAAKIAVFVVFKNKIKKYTNYQGMINLQIRI